MLAAAAVLTGDSRVEFSLGIILIGDANAKRSERGKALLESAAGKGVEQAQAVLDKYNSLAEQGP